MDRRQLKTRQAIFAAFSTLLKSERYEHITVQQIIDMANVGRSTFYAHFDTKDDLLNAICNDIFHHVFNTAPIYDVACSFPAGNSTFPMTLTHVLYHLKEKADIVRAILKSDSEHIFMNYLKQHLNKMFLPYIDMINKDVPKDFLTNHIINSFAETVKWWIGSDCCYSPENVAEFFIKVTSA